MTKRDSWFMEQLCRVAAAAAFSPGVQMQPTGRGPIPLGHRLSRRSPKCLACGTKFKVILDRGRICHVKNKVFRKKIQISCSETCSLQSNSEGTHSAELGKQEKNGKEKWLKMPPVSCHSGESQSYPSVFPIKLCVLLAFPDKPEHDWV